MIKYIYIYAYYVYTIDTCDKNLYGLSHCLPDRTPINYAGGLVRTKNLLESELVLKFAIDIIIEVLY